VLGNFSFVIDNLLAGCSRPGIYGDIREDLSEAHGMGFRALVSLTETPLNASLVQEAGMKYLHLPIEDFSPPTLEQIRKFVDFARNCARNEEPVLVHCHAGVGRTGTMLACYLVADGKSAEESIQTIRSLRPGSVETATQERVVKEFERSLSRK